MSSLLFDRKESFFLPFVNKISECLISVQQMLNFECLARETGNIYTKEDCKYVFSYGPKLRNSLVFG